MSGLGTKQIFLFLYCLALMHYTLSFISRSLSEVIDTLYDSYFHFCYQLALETSAKCSSSNPLRLHDFCHAHSLASLLRTVNASPD